MSGFLEYSVEELEQFFIQVCRGRVPRDGDLLAFRRINKGFGWVFVPGVYLLNGEFTWNGSSIAAGSSGSSTIGVSGVLAGDVVNVNSSEVDVDISWSAFVSSDDEITISYRNNGGAIGAYSYSIQFQVVRPL